MEQKPNLISLFSGKKVLITGHTGFKGSWMTQWLHLYGAHIFGLSKDIPTKPSLFEALELEKVIDHTILDIRNLPKLKEYINKIEPDFIFHLAAQPIVSTSYKDPIETLTTNVIGTANLLDAIRDLQNKCITILITSDKCYENLEWVWGYKETDMLGGKDIYSGSKAAAEIIIHSYYHSFIKNTPNLKLASARAGNVIGGGDWAVDRIVPDCMQSWSKNKKVELRNPGATRPWQHVLEPISGYFSLAAALWEDDKLNGESYNFGPPPENNISVIELLGKLGKSWGLKPEDSYIQIGETKFSEAGLLKLNCEKALFDLKWRPTLELEELIEFTASWYYEFYNNKNDIKNFTINQIHEYELKGSQKSIKWSLS